MTDLSWKEFREALFQEEPEADPEQKIDRLFHAREVASQLHAHFFNHNYFLLNGDGLYDEYCPAEIRRELRLSYHVHKKAIDEALHVLDHRRVNWAGPLAGCKPGLIEFGTNKLLVTKGAHMVEPVKGDCPEAKTLLIKLCGQQWERVCGWLKVARSQILSGARRPGQVLVFCGPKGCGKSTTQEILITAMLGGRKVDPFQFMTNQTIFNSHLFGAEHWMIDDKMPHGDPHARNTLANYMKQAASVVSGNCHPKGQKPLDLPLFCRLSISCNDDDRSLSVLPPLDEDLEGKLIMIAAQSFEFRWPQTDDESVAFNQLLLAQMPAFAYWIDSFQIPEQIKERRYGVSGYVDPQLRQKLSTLGRDAQLLQLARDAIENHKVLGFPHEETSYKWFELIYLDDNLRDGLREITKSPDGLGRIFTRLVNSGTAGISKRMLQGKTVYEIEST